MCWMTASLVPLRALLSGSIRFHLFQQLLFERLAHAQQ